MIERIWHDRATPEIADRHEARDTGRGGTP